MGLIYGWHWFLYFFYLNLSGVLFSTHGSRSSSWKFVCIPPPPQWHSPHVRPMLGDSFLVLWDEYPLVELCEMSVNRTTLKPLYYVCASRRDNWHIINLRKPISNYLFSIMQIPIQCRVTPHTSGARRRTAAASQFVSFRSKPKAVTAYLLSKQLLLLTLHRVFQQWREMETWARKQKRSGYFVYKFLSSATDWVVSIIGGGRGGGSSIYLILGFVCRGYSPRWIHVNTGIIFARGWVWVDGVEH